MLKIRRSRDRLMGIPILIRRHHYIETPPQVVFKMKNNVNYAFLATGMLWGKGLNVNSPCALRDIPRPGFGYCYYLSPALPRTRAPAVNWARLQVEACNYRTRPPNSRQGTGYTNLWPRPTVEPVHMYVWNSYLFWGITHTFVCNTTLYHCF